MLSGDGAPRDLASRQSRLNAAQKVVERIHPGWDISLTSSSSAIFLRLYFCASSRTSGIDIKVKILIQEVGLPGCQREELFNVQRSALSYYATCLQILLQWLSHHDALRHANNLVELASHWTTWTWTLLFKWRPQLNPRKAENQICVCFLGQGVGSQRRLKSPTRRYVLVAVENGQRWPRI